MLCGIRRGGSPPTICIKWVKRSEHAHEQHDIRQDAERQALRPRERGARRGFGGHGQQRGLFTGFQHQGAGVGGKGVLPGTITNGGVWRVP